MGDEARIIPVENDIVEMSEQESDRWSPCIQKRGEKERERRGEEGMKRGGAGLRGERERGKERTMQNENAN
jgi:hypothetical protein